MSTYVETAKQLVHDYVQDTRTVNPAIGFFGLDDVFVVWFAKTLQNWKALVSTTLPDTRYYEVTYNGDRDEYYLDAYVKLANVVIKRPEVGA